MTIYKWIDSKKLPAQIVQAGSQNRIYISRKSVELLKIALDEKRIKSYDAYPSTAPEEMKWIMKYRELIGVFPPFYVPFRRGKVTFEQMRDEAIRRLKAVI